MHDIPERNGKLTDELAVEIFQDNSEVEVKLNDTSSSRRRGKPRNSRPATIKFMRYNIRRNAFMKKKNNSKKVSHSRKINIQ